MRSEMCARLHQLLSTALCLDDAAAARVMEYESTSQLRAIRDGKSFPDVERLARLCQYARETGVHIDLSWLLTGHPAQADFGNTERQISFLLDRLRPEHKKLLEAVAGALAGTVAAFDRKAVGN